MSKGLISKTVILLPLLVCVQFISHSAYARRHSHRHRAIRQVAGTAPSSIPAHIWTKHMNGAISGMALSKSGNAIVVVTNPDHDIRKSAEHYLMTRYSPNGATVWQLRMKFPPKEFGVSRDADLVVVSNYEDQLIGIDAKGKVIWTTQGMCKPYVLQDSRAVICYHDDDAEPGVAFDVFDWNGKKTSGYLIGTGGPTIGSGPGTSAQVAQDVIALKFSADEKALAIGLTGGEVILFGSDFKPLWKSKVDGEVIDLAISNVDLLSPSPMGSSVPSPLPSPFSSLSPSPAPLLPALFKVAVLIRTDRKNQKIIFFDSAGNRVGNATPSFHAGQIEPAATGEYAFYYGNSSNGQFVGGTRVLDTQESWKQGEPHSSRYSSAISIAPGFVLMGLEHATEAPITRESRIVAYSNLGVPAWNLRLPKDDTAYIYAHRISVAPNLFVVGTDDAKLSLYRYR